MEKLGGLMAKTLARLELGGGEDGGLEGESLKMWPKMKVNWVCNVEMIEGLKEY